jgi:hypothetical protein
MPKSERPNTPPQPINDGRKLQLARLERNSPADYARVMATLKPDDKAAVLAHVAKLKGKPLPPLPDPGKPHIVHPEKKK